MVRYRRLNEWAERDQRRFDEQQANPPVPGTEPIWQRALQAFFSVVAMASKCVFFPVLVIWIIVLIAQHTVSSLVLAVVLVMLASTSAFTTTTLIQACRERGENWFTGLAPKVRSD